MKRREPATDAADSTPKESAPQTTEPETIHSRSVQMGSERLGVVAKMDLLNPRRKKGDLFAALEVCPVDYKAGAPKEGEEANELWDTDKMQLGLQALILRDNGYTCNEGIIYYRATKQRVRLAVTPELENLDTSKHRGSQAGYHRADPAAFGQFAQMRALFACAGLFAGRDTDAGASCIGLRRSSERIRPRPMIESTAVGERPRRLIAARDDTRPLYLNTQGYRVGCKDEVLTVKEKDRVIEEVRMRDLSHVALFGNIQISTQAIQSLCEPGNPGHILFDGRLVLRHYARPCPEKRVSADGTISIGAR